MRWVDDPKYYGPDRRRRASARRPERRTDDTATTNEPSIALAVRQLRLRALDIKTPQGLADFRSRLSGVAQLATLKGMHAAAALLTSLHFGLGNEHARRVAIARIDETLNRVIELSDSL